MGRFALFFLLGILITVPPLSAQGWQQVMFDTSSLSYNSACVVNDTTFALFGSQGSVTLVDENRRTMTIRGDRTLPDLIGGTMLNQDSLLMIDSSGRVLVKSIRDRGEKPFSVPIGGRPMACHATRNGVLFFLTTSGLVYRRQDGAYQIHEQIIGSTYYELSDGSVAIGTVDNALVMLTSDFISFDTLTTSISPITGIAQSSDKLWFVTPSSISSSPESGRFNEWTTINLSTARSRSIVCANDTLVVGIDGFNTISQYLTTDGATWVGGNVSIYDYSGYRLLKGASSILVYGNRGFYKVATTSPLYDNSQQTFYGIGRGRNAIGHFRMTSMCQVDDSRWVATAHQPNAVVESKDSGRTWKLLDLRFAEGLTEYPRIRKVRGYFYLLVDTVRSIDVNGSWRTVKQWTMMRSSNLKDWISVTSDSVFHEGLDFDVDSAGAVYVYGNWGLWKIDSSFTSFSNVTVDSPGSVSSMCINSIGTIVAAGNVLMVSKDSSQSWSYHPFPNITAIKKLCWLYDDESVVVIATNGSGTSMSLSAYRSSPPYNEWMSTTIIPSDGRFFTPQAIDHNNTLGTVVVTQSALVAISSDRGETWIVEQPLGRSINILTSVHIRDPKVVRIGGEGSVLMEKDFSVSGITEQSPSSMSPSCDAIWVEHRIDLPIDYVDQQVEIIDLNGAVVMCEMALQDRGVATLTGTLTLAPGLYFVRAVQGGLAPCKMIVGGR